MLNQKAHAAVGADRRNFGRRGSLWHAWIVLGAKQRIACCLRNVSPGGALLELTVPAVLPPRFTLLIEERNFTIQCDLRHRGEHGIGVSFFDPNAGRALFEMKVDQPEKPVVKREVEAVEPSRPRLSAELIAEALRRPF